jgi:hypothetical protein
MARIIDKDTRIIDIDFGPVNVQAVREIESFNPVNSLGASGIGASGNGRDQMLFLLDNPGDFAAGSFIQYERLDLSFMTLNNDVMMPVEVNVQRTAPVPLGYHTNGNNFDPIEEFIYILTAPLNNANLRNLGSLADIQALRSMGLDRSEIQAGVVAEGNAGGNRGWPNQAQCVYAEKRTYAFSENTGATIQNGQLFNPTPPTDPIYNSIMGSPSLESVSTWGGMGAITGPNLHCYRVVYNRTQSFSPALSPLWINVPLFGDTVLNFPPVNIRFLCKDPNFSEGEYLTRIANAMNQTAEGGPTS